MDFYKEYIDHEAHFEIWRYLRITENSLNLFAETGDILICQPKKDVTNDICLLFKLVDMIENKEEVYVLSVATSINKGIFLRPWDDFRI